MRRMIFRMCAAAVVLIPVPLLSAPAADSKTVLVSVVAAASGPVGDLSPADVRMQEGRTPVEVTGVASAGGPISVSLVLDTSYPMGRFPPTQDLRRGVTSFVSAVRSAAPDAQFSLYSVSNAAIPLCDFTADPARIADAIAHLVVGTQAASPMLEGVVDASHALERRPPPRRAIVAVSFGSTEAGAERPVDVAADLLKSGATLWTVSVTGTGDVAQSVARDEVWSRVTAGSGGMGIRVVQASGLETQMKIVANTLASQYTVTFARKRDGPVEQLAGETTTGAKILFSHWVR